MKEIKPQGTALLGQPTQYPSAYDPSLLEPIPRSLGYQNLGLNSTSLPFTGQDIWNLYEVSWLGKGGKPEVGLMSLVVPCTSPNIVESKSLKLYLGSLNQTRFESDAAFSHRVHADLSEVIGVAVDVQLAKVDSASEFLLQAPSGICLDDLDVACEDYQVDAGLLQVNTDKQVSVQFYSHLLRSLCPVTSQPDWATVMIELHGAEVQPESLLKYIVSFRNHQDFHEQCVERIFIDLLRATEPQYLLVQARFNRRGGIDINPVRCTDETIPHNFRLIRQ